MEGVRGAGARPKQLRCLLVLSGSPHTEHSFTLAVDTHLIQTSVPGRGKSGARVNPAAPPCSEHLGRKSWYKRFQKALGGTAWPALSTATEDPILSRFLALTQPGQQGTRFVMEQPWRLLKGTEHLLPHGGKLNRKCDSSQTPDPTKPAWYSTKADLLAQTLYFRDFHPAFFFCKTKSLTRWQTP